MRWLLGSLCVILFSMAAAGAEPAKPDRGFLDCKTVFQTNTGYDPRLAIAVDGVIVHQHGAAPKDVGKAMDSWRQHGFTMGRMFFADSDATNEYWTGKWDGTKHPDEVERTEKDDVVMCAGVRPYMLPTPGWTKYLQQMATASIDVGAQAILPEEPLAHAHTGYEGAFRKAWEQRYHRPWEPEKASPTARFLTGQLKNEFYLELERQLGQTVSEGEKRTGRPVPFVFPVHSLYSNVAAHLVAPLGTSTAIEQIDGYIGQVWTGPVNWALHNYSSPDKSFFSSAYVLLRLLRSVDAGQQPQTVAAHRSGRGRSEPQVVRIRGVVSALRGRRVAVAERRRLRGHALAGSHLPARLLDRRQHAGA